MILPPGAVLGKAVEEPRQTSRTYRIDLINGRIAGMVDEIEALKQTVYKIIDTERFAHFIYSGNFGMVRRSVGGFALDLERWVTEALLVDDRITRIEGFQSTVTGDEATVSFTVVSIYGAVSVERGLGIGV